MGITVEEHNEAIAAIDELIDSAGALREAIETGDAIVPPRAVTIIRGASETVYALVMGGWPWLNPYLQKMSRP